MSKPILLSLVLLSATGIIAHGSTAIADVSEQIVKTVKEFEYSDAVAKDLLEMVSGWKDPQDRSLLDSSKKKLKQAKEEHQRGDMSEKELADVELDVIGNLVRSIKRQVTYESSASDLSTLINNSKANCLGFTQLFYVLGNAIGLSIGAVVVKDMGERPYYWIIKWEKGGAKYVPSEMSMRPSTFVGHVVGSVYLGDGKEAMVDLASNRELRGPFEFEEVYRKVGIYWEKSETDENPLFYPRIRKLSHKSFIGDIKMSRATQYLESKEYEKMISILSEASSLNPEDALVYFNRAQAYTGLAKFTEAEADYRRALDLDPKFPLAYQELGKLHMRTGEYKKAYVAFQQALACDPDLAESYLNMAELQFASGDYLAATKGYIIARIQFSKGGPWSDQPVSKEILGHISYRQGMSWYELKIYYVSETYFLEALKSDPTLENKVEKMLKLIKTQRVQNLKDLNPSNIPELIAQAKSNDFPADQLAMESLVTLGPLAIPALVEILKDKDELPGFFYRVCEALAAIGRTHNEVVSILIQDLKDPSAYLGVKEVLIRLGETAIPALQKAATGQDENLCKKIEDILERIEADRNRKTKNQ